MLPPLERACCSHGSHLGPLPAPVAPVTNPRPEGCRRSEGWLRWWPLGAGVSQGGAGSPAGTLSPRYLRGPVPRFPGSLSLRHPLRAAPSPPAPHTPAHCLPPSSGTQEGPWSQSLCRRLRQIPPLRVPRLDARYSSWYSERQPARCLAHLSLCPAARGPAGLGPGAWERPGSGGTRSVTAAEDGSAGLARDTETGEAGGCRDAAEQSASPGPAGPLRHWRGGAGVGRTRPPPGPSFPAPGPQRWGVGVSVPRKRLCLSCLHRLNSRLAHLSEEQTFLLLENPSFGKWRTHSPPPMSESPREGRGVHVTFFAATHLPDALCGGVSSSPKGVGGKRGTTPACTPTPSPFPAHLQAVGTTG